jgi:hypothetical protein
MHAMQPFAHRPRIFFEPGDKVEWGKGGASSHQAKTGAVVGAAARAATYWISKPKSRRSDDAGLQQRRGGRLSRVRGPVPAHRGRRLLLLLLLLGGRIAAGWRWVGE